jgi:phage tail sheath protein FI
LSGPLPAQRPNATRAKNPGDPIPYIEMTSSGSDGEELTDYDVIGSDKEGTGLFALDVARGVDLVCVPSAPSGRDLGITALLATERYCRQRRAILVLDPPSTWRSPEAALLGIRTSSFSSRNALTYFPRLRPRDGAERFPDGLPACGVLAGLLAHNDRNGVWHALDTRTAQRRAGLSPVGDVDARQAAMLQRQGINVFARADSGGFMLKGNVTMAGPNVVSSLWQRLDRRRLAFFILGTIQRCTWWALSEPRDDALWRKLHRQVNTFLLGLHAQGALPGERAEQAFLVKIGPEVQMDEATLVVRVGFALKKPNEFLIYDIVHRADGSEARALPPLDAAQLAG